MRADILAYAFEGLLADQHLTHLERVSMANSMLGACMTPMPVTIPANLSYTGTTRTAIKGIDTCIADIIKALNDAGIGTTGCCCGHGMEPGTILLTDGRELTVVFPAGWEG